MKTLIKLFIVLTFIPLFSYGQIRSRRNGKTVIKQLEKKNTATQILVRDSITGELGYINLSDFSNISNSETENSPGENEVNSDDGLFAFPTAYGGGANATGGRGGQVIYVSNLNDSGTGSLRAALQTEGTRTIVFSVAGIINLAAPIFVLNQHDNFTLAGQTSPDGGITITGDRIILDIGLSNFIIRYIRFRGGEAGDNDSFTAIGVSNGIFDHTSVSFGDDEGLSITASSGEGTVNNLTVQYSIIAENNSGGGLTGGLQNPDGTNNYDGSGNLTYYHNLFYNSRQRFPNVSGNGRVDILNNVAYPVTTRATRGNGSIQVLQLNNYYTYNTPIHDDILHHYSFETGYSPSIYADGNLFVSQFGVRTGSSYTFESSLSEINTDNFLSWKFFINGTDSGVYGITNRGDQLPEAFRASTQFTQIGRHVQLLTAEEIYNTIHLNVGNNKRLLSDGSTAANLDSLDSQWLAVVPTGNFEDRLNSTQYITPSFTGGTPYVDSDLDGMSDVWEQATFNTLSRDGTGDLDGDGYTDLEEFLNLIDL